MDKFSPVEVMKRCSVILWSLLCVLICVRGELTLQTSRMPIYMGEGVSMMFFTWILYSVN